MNQILEIGHLCRIDDNGDIVNESDIHKVQNLFMEPIHCIKEYCLSFLPNDIHSIYIRGSVPRGLGIEGISDLDCIIITHSSPKSLDLNWVEKAEKEINNRCSSINGVELSFHSLLEATESKYFSIIPFMLKTHSICLYGEDLSSSLPNYKANLPLANDHIIKIKSQIQRAKRDLDGNQDIEDIKDCCVWIMKLMIRCGLALVIVDEKTYTRDLYPAYQLFSKHYPQKEKHMRKALEFAVNPSSNPIELLHFLNDFGDWLNLEAEEWMIDHNPDRIEQLFI
ncbi:nucleotidyltransferase [Bacillus sp. CGMCC 1.16607]|uniref:nucleotidyltransferase n=1 Tax=Bacillus sp. CGMCC 1.16607 TaxID=3351842 RepID=UPI00363EF2A5